MLLYCVPVGEQIGRGAVRRSQLSGHSPGSTAVTKDGSSGPEKPVLSSRGSRRGRTADSSGHALSESQFCASRKEKMPCFFLALTFQPGRQGAGDQQRPPALSPRGSGSEERASQSPDKDGGAGWEGRALFLTGPGTSSVLG